MTMRKTRRQRRRSKLIEVVYHGLANTLICAATRQCPEGYKFPRDLPCEVPTSLWPVLERLAATTDVTFERLGDVPEEPTVEEDANPAGPELTTVLGETAPEKEN